MSLASSHSRTYHQIKKAGMNPWEVTPVNRRDQDVSRHAERTPTTWDRARRCVGARQCLFISEMRMAAFVRVLREESHQVYTYHDRPSSANRSQASTVTLSPLLYRDVTQRKCYRLSIRVPWAMGAAISSSTSRYFCASSGFSGATDSIGAGGCIGVR